MLHKVMFAQLHLEYLDRMLMCIPINHLHIRVCQKDKYYDNVIDVLLPVLTHLYDFNI